MKKGLPKILTLFAALTLCLSAVRGAGTYAPLDNPATKEYGGITFLDVAGTKASGKITATGDTYEGDSVVTYSAYYIAKTKAITTWYNSSDGSPAGNLETSGATIENPTTLGFYTVSSTQGDINYGGAKVHSTRQRYFYVTGATSVAAVVKDNNGTKYIQISKQEVASDGTLGSATTIGAATSTSAYLLEGGALDHTKYYKITFTSNNTSNCYLYQVRFNKYTAPATTYTVTYKAGLGTGSDVVDNAATTVADCPAGFTAPTDMAFAGWKDASDNDVAVGATVSADMTLTAQWATAYTVTYNAGEGTGTVPTETAKTAGATFEVAGQGAMTHATKVFDGWKDQNGTAYAAGATYTVGTENVVLTAQWKAAPKVLFHYQWTGTGSAPAKSDVLTATGGTILVSTYGSNSLGTQSLSSYAAGTPDDMKVEATSSMKFIKFGNNDPYMELTLTTGKFKTGDTVYISGYAAFSISSSVTTASPSGDLGTLTTGGTGSNNAGVGYLVLPKEADEDAEFEHLYVSRKSGSSAYFAAIKVVRPVQYTVNFAAGDGGTGTMEAKKYPAGATVTLPECTFTAPSLKEFDAWTSADVTISSNKFTMPANDVTVTATWKNETPKYTVTYSKGANGTGTIAADTKVKDVNLTLSSERFTRDGYLQTGWAETDGGAQAYALGASYTANAPIELFPVWTAVDTYTAAFTCGDAAPAGWTFSNDGFDSDAKATATYVCKFTENSLTAPDNNGMSADAVAFAKNTSAIATYDLGITTTVVALDVTLYGGSSSAFNETIEYLGEDGTTVKKEYTNSLGAGNWAANSISKTDLIEDVRYIRVHGASKWVVMKDFSVKYIETRTKYDVTFAAGDGTGTMETLKCIEGATVTVPASTFTAPTNQEFEKWAINGVVGITEINPAETFTMPANSVTLTAQWQTITDKYTVVYKDGTTDLGSETVEVGKHPKATGITTDKPFYTFESWQLSGSDVALSDVSGTKDEVINLVARYTAKYAQSINIEQWILDNRKNNTEFRAVLDAKGYEYDNLNDLDSLNDGKDYRNYPFLGQKIKAANASISFFLKAGSKARIRFGNVGASFTLKVGSDETTLDNSYANTTVASKISHEVNAASDVVVQIINVENNKTLVIKQIMIDEPIADVVLPWRVTYDANGGTCTTPEAIWKGSAITLPAATPADPADVFDGWYDDPSAGTKIGAAGETYNATANVTLYAHYVAAPPTPDYTRTGLSAGKIGTLFVGYATSSYSGATFYQLAGKSADGQQITFEEVTGQLEADKPYIFEASAGQIDLYYADPSATQVAEADHNGLYGVTSEQHIAASAEIYYFSNNQLYKADAFSGGATYLTVGANRCYIKIAKVPGGVSPKPGRKYISLHMNGGQVATGIGEVQGDKQQCTKVLINGTLFILRGEKMYDTTGRLVK